MKYILLLTASIFLMMISSCRDQTTENEPYIIDLQYFEIRTDLDTNYAYQNTENINRALQYAKKKNYRIVEFPKGTYLIASDWDNLPSDDPTSGVPGIIVPSDITLDLSNATFHLLPNNHGRYSLFLLYGVKNVTIIGGHLIGDRLNHDYSYDSERPNTSTHEFGYGIKIAHSENIVIKEVKIEQMTGDGVIIGGLGKFNNSRKVVVTKCELFDCRRQGITIYAGIECELSYNKIYHIKGTPPQTGIDIEIEEYHTGEYIKIHNNQISRTEGGAIVCNSGDYIDVYENEVKEHVIAVYNSKYVNIYNNTLINTCIQITHPENVKAYNNRFITQE